MALVSQKVDTFLILTYSKHVCPSNNSMHSVYDLIMVRNYLNESCFQLAILEKSKSENASKKKTNPKNHKYLEGLNCLLQK